MLQAGSADAPSTVFDPEREADLYTMSGAVAFPIPDFASAMLAPARAIVREVCLHQRPVLGGDAEEEGAPVVDGAALVTYLKDVARLSVGLFGVSEHK